VLDLVIRNGQLIDGTGAPRRPGAVGIRDGRVVVLGDVDEPAARTIDADGAVVAPGFVDPHTHYDAQACWDPTLAPSTLHGITTMVAGNCGFSVAPLSRDSADYVMRMLSRVEGMPLEALQAGVSWDWQTTGEYLDRIERQVSANIGFMVGHSTMRRAVMGEAANQREATSDEIEAMKALLRDGLAAGGLGFSSSLTVSHNDGAGDPVPSRFAAFDELVQLAEVCGGFPGTSLELAPFAGPVFPESHIDLMVELSARAGRTLNWNVIRIGASNTDEIEAKLAISDRARATGGRVVPLVLARHNHSRLNFGTGYVFGLLPAWSKAMALPVPEKLALLGSASGRAELRQLAAESGPLPGWMQWERYEIHECFTPETRRYEGRTVEATAREEGKDPFDALLDVVVADGLRTSIAQPAPPDSDADWEARGRWLRDPRVVVGASDAGAHLDMIDSFNYVTRLLQQCVREHGVLSTEEAVHLVTQVPAELFGMRARGVLREGAWADVVVFDEATVGCGRVHTRHDLPAGAARLYAESTGIHHVIVNGEPIVDHGEHTGACPGRVLRSGRDTVTPSLT
jgi:N-acyl-D-aspartate/D-glutamate deacylase